MQLVAADGHRMSSIQTGVSVFKNEGFGGLYKGYMLACMSMKYVCHVVIGMRDVQSVRWPAAPSDVHDHTARYIQFIVQSFHA